MLLDNDIDGERKVVNVIKYIKEWFFRGKSNIFYFIIIWKRLEFLKSMWE